MNNLETNETRARYKEQEARIMNRSELSDEQKDAAIDALFDRYCADYNCWGSNLRTQTRLSQSSGSSYGPVTNGVGGGTIVIFILLSICIWLFWDETMAGMKSLLPLILEKLKAL